MSKRRVFPVLWAVALVMGTASGAVFAAEPAQETYSELEQKAVSVRRQLYAKETELDALYAGNELDSDKARQLFRDIGELKGQLFAVQAELRAKFGEPGARYGDMGMYHRGAFGQGGGGCPGRMGYGGHMGYRGNMMGGGRHHGGWDW